MGNKEFGGVVLAFAGFVFLVGAVKGTWRNAYHALTGGTPAATGSTTGAPSNSGGGSAGNQSSNLPGSAPAPFGGR